jgi:hypothetical protein
MTSPFSTARAAAILAATALIATGCTDAGDAPSSSSTTAPVAIDYTIDAKPVWTFDPEAANPGTDYLSNPGDIALDGDQLVIAPLTNMPLTVVDLAAGSIAWTLKEFSGPPRCRRQHQRALPLRHRGRPPPDRDHDHLLR